MAPLRGDKKMPPEALSLTTSSVTSDTPVLRPRKSIVVYNERQLQVRANDERQSRSSFANMSQQISNGIAALDATPSSTLPSLSIEEENKKSSRKRRFSVDPPFKPPLKVAGKRGRPRKPEPKNEEEEEEEDVASRIRTRNSFNRFFKKEILSYVKNDVEHKMKEEDFKTKLVRITSQLFGNRATPINTINNTKQLTNVAAKVDQPFSNMLNERRLSNAVNNSKFIKSEIPSLEGFNSTINTIVDSFANPLDRFDRTMEAVVDSLANPSAEFVDAIMFRAPAKPTPPPQPVNLKPKPSLTAVTRPYVYTPRTNLKPRDKTLNQKSKEATPTALGVATASMTTAILATKTSATADDKNSPDLMTSSTTQPSPFTISFVNGLWSSASRFDSLLFNINNYCAKNSLTNDFVSGSDLLNVAIPANLTYDDIFRFPQARTRWTVMSRTTIDVSMLGRALFHDDPSWSQCSFPKRSLFGRECIVYFFKSQRWQDKKLVFVPYGKPVIPGDVPYTCGSCFKISACLKHRFDLKQRNKLPVVVARQGKFIDNPDWPRIPHICDPQYLGEAERAALADYGELMAKNRVCDKPFDVNIAPSEIECRNLLIVVEARLTECCVKLLSVGFDFTEESMREKALEISHELNLPAKCVTKTWLAGVSKRLGVPVTTPEVLSAVATSNCDDNYCSGNDSSPSAVSEYDIIGRSDAENYFGGESSVLTNGGFLNMNDYLQSLVKDALRSQQVEENNNKNEDKNSSKSENPSKIASILPNSSSSRSTSRQSQDDGLPLLESQQQLSKESQLSCIAEGISVHVKESCPIEFVSSETPVDDVSDNTSCLSNSKLANLMLFVPPSPEMTTGEFLVLASQVKEKSSFNEITIKKEIINDGEKAQEICRLSPTTVEDENAYSQMDELVDAQTESKSLRTKNLATAFKALEKDFDTRAVKQLKKNEVVAKSISEKPETSSINDKRFFNAKPIRRGSRRRSVEVMEKQKSKNEKKNFEIDIPPVSSPTNLSPALSSLGGSCSATTMNVDVTDQNTLHAVIQSSFTKINYPEVAEALETIKKHIELRDCSLIPMFNSFSTRIAKMMHTSMPRTHLDDITGETRKPLTKDQEWNIRDQAGRKHCIL